MLALLRYPNRRHRATYLWSSYAPSGSILFGFEELPSIEWCLGLSQMKIINFFKKVLVVLILL